MIQKSRLGRNDRASFLIGKGDKGDKGDTGAKGVQGEQGIQGEQGVGVSEVAIVNDELVITLSNGEWFNLGNIKGAKGDKGDTGAKGDKGEQGEQGIQGVSITEVTLTAEGELSMKFSNGQIVPLGNIKGKDGTDGVGIANTVITADGNLVITYTNGVTKDLGSVKGPKGDKGDQGEQGPKGDKGKDGQDGTDGVTPKLQIGANNYWYVSYDNGTTWESLNAKATGEKGDNGDTGETGAAGRGIVKTEIIDGHLWITYSDDLENPVDLGIIVAPEDEGTYGLAYYPLPDGSYGVSGGNTIYLSEIVIPKMHNGKPVTKILDNAFKDNLNIEKISIPDTITHIGDNAFYGCSNLKEFNFPKETAVIEYYGNSAFYLCSSLTEIYITEGTASIGGSAFIGCNAVESITLPSTLTSIGTNALQISFNNLKYASIKCGGTWRSSSSHVYSQNGTVYTKKTDGTYDASSNSGYTYDYLFIEDLQLAFEEIITLGKMYAKYSTSSTMPSANKYVYIGSLGRSWEKIN